MKSKINKTVFLFLFLGLNLLLNSCKEEELPHVITSLITNVTGTTATCGGVITDNGYSMVLERGICWSTGSDPSLDDSTVYSGSGAGTFTVELAGLEANTTYYVRAFAINESGTNYGIVRSFHTRGQLPYAKTKVPTNIKATSAYFNAEVNANYLLTDVFFEFGPTAEYGNTISALQDPLTGDAVTEISKEVKTLIQGTIYHYRVKTVNSLGTTYGEDISFITLGSDPDGNLYKVVAIGNQIWMAENLKTTKYKDGTKIPQVTNGTDWANLSNPAYCWYDNNAGYKNIYGALYNWYTVKTGKLCPAGWHVPSDSEWNTLINFLGGKEVAGGKLKETGTKYWASPNAGATNEYGFTALPAGCRKYDGVFFGRTGNANWRTSTEYDGTTVLYKYIFYYSGTIYGKNTNKTAGYSVRCIRD